MADFKKIMRSPEFHFLVGPEHESVAIHSGLIQVLSDPLWALINNGMMRESVSKSATLEDLEVDTFIGFCEFAYTGTYRTPERMICDEADGANAQELEAKVDCDLSALEKWGVELDDQDIDMIKKGRIPNFNSFPGSHQRALSMKKIAHGSDARQWSQFASLHFDGEQASHSSDPDLVFHAKLYVFATRYLVEALRQQCLKSLHRDLCDMFPIGPDIPLVLDLLEYTYQETGRREPGGPSPLRELVIHFAACVAQTLAQNTRFRDLLDEFAEMGSDLVVKLVTWGSSTTSGPK